MNPREFFYKLFLDEYFFTFLATALSVIFKALSSRETLFFKKRNTYDLGIELVFIAVSFVLSHLSSIVGAMENALLERDTLAQKLKILSSNGMVWTDGGKLIVEQLQSVEGRLAHLELAQTSQYIILGSLVVYLFTLVVYMRQYALEPNGEVHLIRGILIPDFLGVLAVILALAFGVSTPGQ